MSTKVSEVPILPLTKARGLVHDEGSYVAKDPSQKKTFWACWFNINEERRLAPFLASAVLHSPLNGEAPGTQREDVQTTEHLQLETASCHPRAPESQRLVSRLPPYCRGSHSAGKRPPCKGTPPRRPQSQGRPASQRRTWE